MELFMPTRVFFEPGALDYPLGRELYELMTAKGIPCRLTSSHNRVLGIPGETPQIAYREAKRTWSGSKIAETQFLPSFRRLRICPRDQLSGWLSVLLSRYHSWDANPTSASMSMSMRFSGRQIIYRQKPPGHYQF